MSTPNTEPMFELAEFSSFELFSPVVDETLWFFKDLLGMIETGRQGDSVYLRGWQDPYSHSLKITYRDRPGMGSAGWRAMSQPALERRVKALESTGRGRGWVDGEVGVGDAYEFTLPDGALQRIHWDVEYYKPAPAREDGAAQPPEPATAVRRSPPRARPPQHVGQERHRQQRVLRGEPGLQAQ
jgi:catechol 2,3-dioxygenase